jgi:hypothetical protein
MNGTMAHQTMERSAQHPEYTQDLKVLRTMLKAFVLGCLGLGWTMSALARPSDELPGEEVVIQKANPRAPVRKPSSTDETSSWLAPKIDEQLSRDEVLLTVSKGAVFIPTMTEGRREPEVGVLTKAGKLVNSGHTGMRLLLDSGTYDIRVGSGTTHQQMIFPVTVGEGHTELIQPQWGGLLVETLTDDGEYFEGQYEVVRLDRNGWFGRGRGLGEERLQDIKVWLLAPGVYRLGKVGDPASSLRSFITVEIHAGELQSIELIYADATSSSDIIAGGYKSLNTRTSAGNHWNYGLRAGGNLGLISNIDESDAKKESAQFSSDIRMRARYDAPVYFGLTEVSLRDNFIKNRNSPLSVVTDEAQARSTWVRRLNTWIGPYLRGQVLTHFFPNRSTADTIYIVSQMADAAMTNGVRTDTLSQEVGGDFRFEPSFFPLLFSEGLGVNLDMFSTSLLELSTQIGLAAHQKFARQNYVALTPNTYYRNKTETDIGLETLVNARLRLSNIFTLDGRCEVFAPNAELREIQLSDLELDFRLNLSRFVELGYLFQIRELSETAANRFPRSHNLSLRFNLNY